MKDRKDLNKEDCKWESVPNFTDTGHTFHCYYPRIRKTAYIHEEYEGGGALCNKKNYISEDGEHSLPFDKIGENDSKFGRCKSCEKIYNKLPK